MTSQDTLLPPTEDVETPSVVCHVIYNTLRLDQRSTGRIVWADGKTLADYLEGLPEHVEWGVAVNETAIERDDWPTTTLKPNDTIVVVAIPEGGGGDGKSIMRMVAMIAVSVAAAAVAGPLVGAMGLTGTMAGVATSVVTGLVTTVGGLLVNALLPPPKPKTPEQTDLSAESPSYGIDGAKNTATEDVVVPVVYGEFRTGGNLTAIQTENVDDTQYLKMMAVVSEGPIESITNVEINKQPASNFIEVETRSRMGQARETMSEWFASTIRQINKGVTLAHDVWATHTTEGEVDGLRVDVVFPQGLGYIEDDGSISPRGVRLDVEYRQVGETFWQPMQTTPSWIQSGSASMPEGSTGLRVEVEPVLFNTGDFYHYERGDHTDTRPVRAWDVRVEYAGPDGVWHTFGTDAGVESRWYYGGSTAERKTFEIGGLAPAAYQIRVTGGNMTNSWTLVQAGPEIVGAQRKALRRSYWTPALDEGFYEIRVKRNAPPSEDGRTLDMVAWTDVGEVIAEQVAYNYTAWYGLKIKLSEQLNSVPQITALVRGKKVPHYDHLGNHTTTAWTSNPAWIALDILTNDRYGAGLPLERFDMPKWFEWAEWCALRGYEFNGIFDFKTNVWDAAQMVFRVGHAQIVRVGTRYSLAIEKPETPAMMFGPGNIIKDSFAIEWLSMEDRANEVEINYYDRDDGFRRKIVRVVDETALARGLPQKVASITLPGITHYEQARFEGYFHMALNRLIQQTVTFDAPLEAIACTVGDTVLVQHDMPQWGYSGRLEPGSTATRVKLDRPVSMQSGKTYKFLVMHPALRRGTAAITMVTEKSILISGTPSGRVRRIKVGDRDLGVARIVAGTWSELILSEAPTGLSVGQTVELWDTDAIEEKSVSGSGEVTEISVALSQVPADFAHWMFGEVKKVAKPFRVQSMVGNGVETRTIKATEYVEEAYLDPENAGLPEGYSDLPVTIGHVVVDAVREEKLTPDGMVMRCWFSWRRPAYGVYAGADVYIGVNGDPLTLYTTVMSGGTTFSFDAGVGDMLQVRLVAIDKDGNKPPFETAPVFDYTVVGAGVPPEAPFNLTATGGIRLAILNWELPADPSIDHIEVWCSETPNREEASLVAHAYGTTHTVNGLRGIWDYWFWIRSANKAGLVSEWNSDMGTYVRTEPLDGGDIADAIIDSSHLIPELAEQLERIDVDAILNDIRVIQDEMTLVHDDVTTIHEELAGRVQAIIDNLGIPDVEGLSEDLLNALTLGYEHFEEIKANRGITDRRAAVVDTKVQELQTEDANLAEQVTTVAAEFDDKIALVNQNLNAQATEDAALAQQITELSVRVDEDIAAAINETNRVMASADQSLAESINTLSSELNGNIAVLQTNQQTLVENDQALAQNITTLSSQMDDSIAILESNDQALASNDQALATSIDTLSSELNGNIAILESNQQTLVDNDQSLAQSINTLSADFNDKYALIQSNTQALADADQALAQSINSLNATFNDNYAVLQNNQQILVNNDQSLASSIDSLGTRLGNAETAITNEQTARSTFDQAVVQDLNNLAAAINNNSAAITNEQNARASADGSLANNITTLQTAHNNMVTTVNQTVNAVNGLSGQYTVKIDNNGYVTGFGLASYPRNGTPYSEFIVRADAFAVVQPGYPGIVPFGVYGGRVTMDAAYIRDLSVDTIKIKNGAISQVAGASGSYTATAYINMVNSGTVTAWAFGQTEVSSAGDNPGGSVSITLNIDGHRSAQISQWVGGGGVSMSVMGAMWVNPGGHNAQVTVSGGSARGVVVVIMGLNK
jgi:predicted phage tail protein